MHLLKRSFLGILFLLGLSILFISFGDYGSLSNYEVFLLFNDPNRNLYFLIILISTVHLVFVVQYYEMVHNRFDRIIAIRDMSARYTFVRYFKVFYSVALFMIVFYAFLGIMISLRHHSAAYTRESSPVILSFSHNPSWEVIFYSCFSSIGFAVYSLVFVSLSDFIKNKYLFVVLPIVVLFLSVVLISITTPFINYITQVSIHRVFMTLYVPVNLLNPGMLLGHGYLSFTLSLLLYSFISWGLFKKSTHMRSING